MTFQTHFLYIGCIQAQYTCVLCLYTCEYDACTHKCVCACVHRCLWMYVNTCMYLYIYIHAYIYIQHAYTICLVYTLHWMSCTENVNIHTLNMVYVCHLWIMCSCARHDVIHPLCLVYVCFTFICIHSTCIH